MNLIAGNLPGYVPAEGRCIPCSGVFATSVNKSSCSSHGLYKCFSKIKISLNCSSRTTSYVCSATPGSYRRNRNFSKQNKNGFFRRTSKQNEERDDADNPDELESFPSKNGPLSVANSQKFQATAAPGPREKEIVEMFREVQVKLRQKVGIKEEKKVDDLQGGSKQVETMDALLGLLKKNSVQKGKRNSSGSSRDFVLDQPEQNVPFSEKTSASSFESNNTVKQDDKESEPSIFSRPPSSFQRRSPISRVKYRPVYSDEETVNSVSLPNINGKQKKESHEPEPKLNSKSEMELEPETIFSDGGFDDMLEYETSENDEGDNDEDGGEGEGEEVPNVIQEIDLGELKLVELRTLAKSRGMKRFSKLKKHELLELLTGGGSI
ncbi:hypothetical protein LguiA_011617 [Lonicera macranthoides]